MFLDYFFKSVREDVRERNDCKFIAIGVILLAVYAFSVRYPILMYAGSAIFFAGFIIDLDEITIKKN